MSLVEALKGASEELQGLRPVQRIRKILQLGRIIVSELTGTLLSVPYGARALKTYYSLPTLEGARGKSNAVTLVKDVRYSEAERCVMDIYLPAQARLDTEIQGDTEVDVPVALFCHGGIWATGSKWHYAPMATRLAEAGVIVAVMQYSLYPQALAPQMISEVSSALSWTMDNMHRFGGGSGKVSLMGHSAGAHLCAMALLHRAAQHKSQRPEIDRRMPSQFIGMAGVYDIAQHYEYEDGRGVAKLSTMARAMGGHDRFGQLSPSTILAETCYSHMRRHTDHSSEELSSKLHALHGERLSLRMGLNHQPDKPLPLTSTASRAVAGPMDSLVNFSMEDAVRLPPMILSSGFRDTVVPWYESSEFCIRLRDIGVQAKKLMYKNADHGTFVTGWRRTPRHKLSNDPEHSDLPEACQDVMTLVTNPCIKLEFSKSAFAGASSAPPFGFEELRAEDASEYRSTS